MERSCAINSTYRTRDWLTGTWAHSVNVSDPPLTTMCSSTLTGLKLQLPDCLEDEQAIDTSDTYSMPRRYDTGQLQAKPFVCKEVIG